MTVGRRRALRGHLRRLPRRRIDRRRTASTSIRPTATSSTRGGARTRTRSATCRATAAPATGTATAASPISRPTARSPRSSSRTPCRRSSPPACSSPARRDGRGPRRRAGPACGRTTAGWPTGAPSTRPGGPASPRCSSTTSTARSPRRGGPPTHGLRGGILIPGRPRRLRHRAALLRAYDPLWRVCEELGLVVNHHSGQRPPRLRRPQRLAVHVGHRDRRGSRTAPFWQLVMSGVFDRFPTLKFVLTEQGCAWLPSTLHDARRHAHARRRRPHRRAEDGPRQPASR